MGGCPRICRDPGSGPANLRDWDTKPRDSRDRDKNLRDSLGTKIPTSRDKNPGQFRDGPAVPEFYVMQISFSLGVSGFNLMHLNCPVPSLAHSSVSLKPLPRHSQVKVKVVSSYKFEFSRVRVFVSFYQ